MTDTIRYLNQDYPVTTNWALANNLPAYGSLEKEDLEPLRDKLLKLSNDRRLTDDERADLEIITNHINARNGVKWLRGRPLREIGMTGVDQVHGQSCTLSCGCTLHHVYDHHKRHDSDLTIHPHHGHHLCTEHHKRFKHLNLQDLHGELLP